MRQRQGKKIQGSKYTKMQATKARKEKQQLNLQQPKPIHQNAGDKGEYTSRKPTAAESAQQ